MGNKAKREYSNRDLTVYWYPERCSHPGICIRALPEVFDVSARPWVNIDGAPPEEIIEVIDSCPSGALRYSLPAGSRVDPAAACGPGSAERCDKPEVCVCVSGRGPLELKGPVAVIGKDGEKLRSGTRMVLCGCGKTRCCPFCDGSHRF